MSKILTVGVMSYEDMKARTMAIARGELRPSKSDPKVWFTSIESVAKVLSARNRELLEQIATQQPASLAELETISGRARSNLSRTLRTMEKYGLVTLEPGENRTIRPRVPYDRIKVDMAVFHDA